MAHLAHQVGARIVEVPILFVDPTQRTSKMSWRVALGAARRIMHVAKMRWLRGPHPALRNPQVCVRLQSKRTKRIFLALGGIGDTVLSFAAARRLRASFPDDHLTALAMWPQSADLLEDLGVFDEVIRHHFQSESLFKSLGLIFRLRWRRFDTSILTYPANRFEYNVVQWLIHARRRIGHDYLRGRSLTYLRWLLTDRVPQEAGTHNVLENLKLLEPLGIPATAAAPDITLGPLAPEYRQQAMEVLPRSDRPLIGIHAGSSTYKNLQAKRWPAEHFAKLCNRIVPEDGCIPVLFGGPQDQTLNAEISALCPSTLVLKASPIRLTAALIQRCSVFVSNDSSLAHLASALDVPTVMIVGPTNGLEVGPFSSSGCVVSASLNCSPCFGVSRASLRCLHPHGLACVSSISVGRVLSEVRNRLADQHELMPTLRESRTIQQRTTLANTTDAPTTHDSGHPWLSSDDCEIDSEVLGTAFACNDQDELTPMHRESCHITCGPTPDTRSKPAPLTRQAQGS